MRAAVDDDDTFMRREERRDDLAWRADGEVTTHLENCPRVTRKKSIV